MKLNEKMFQEEILSVVFVCSPADKPTNQQLDTGENRTFLVEHTKQNSRRILPLKDKREVRWHNNCFVKNMFESSSMTRTLIIIYYYN